MIGLLPLLLLAAEPTLDCENAMTQADMNQCAFKDYQSADAELNAQWQKTSSVMKSRDENFESEYDTRSGYFDTLLEAQRAWLGYRDAQCRSEGYVARGGSLEPLLVSSCMAHLTRLRTAELEELVENN
jgi:uncharacterized protein YecT (DUF1311 family)